MLEVWDARLHASDATRHPPVVLGPGARARVDAATVEVQVVGVAATARRRRPIVPAGITEFGRRRPIAPGVEEIIRI